jgi:hypothetical protein
MISPLYGQLSPLRVPTKSGRSTASDADAEAYLLAVEAADLQPIEDAVAVAIDNFVVGCKSDGIWSAIKAACILAGARTLTGALVPLVGTAPTPVSFVSADYNRKTGLKGDRTNKYLNANRAANSDPLNSKHLYCRILTEGFRSPTSGTFIGYLGSSGNTSSVQVNGTSTATGPISYRLNASGGTNVTAANPTSSLGVNRSNSTQITMLRDGSITTASQSSSSSGTGISTVFAVGAALSKTDASLGFYSFGESIDLALLDTRVGTLMSALSAAIP